MGWWTDHVVPRMTDCALSAPEISQLREQACSGLRGRVLEVGFGSGLNLPHLPPEVESVDAVEPSELGWSRSQHRRSRAAVPVQRIGLDGQAIDSKGAYDSALVTFSLCTIPEPHRALAEVARLLRSGGRLHFLEHGLSPDARVARWQNRLDGIQGLAFGGCRLTRDVPALLAASGLEVVELEQRYLVPGPAVAGPWAYGYLGTAQPSS